MKLLVPRPARMKDGREILIRHGVAGDELSIARLIVDGFPIYLKAARGNRERSAACLAQEIRIEHTVVAVIRDSGLIIGTLHYYESTWRQNDGLTAIRLKLKVWGWYSLLRFIWARITAILLSPSVRIAPGELCKLLAAVDPLFQSQGIFTQVANFIEDYAIANDFRVAWSLHEVDNAPVLAVQRKRGCTLTLLPPTPLGRLLHRPGIIKSVKLIQYANKYPP